ncbi:hypothetical protein Ndes2526B_g02984 [Nannochloris sp. 'desiccata']
MSFLRALYELPHKVRNFLSPNNKKRRREEATENIEVESLPYSKRHATTRFVVEEPPKQGLSTLQSHALQDTNVNHITASVTPVAIPKTSFTWGQFAPHSTRRHNKNNTHSGAMQKKSLLAHIQVGEDAKGLEIYKAGVEAHQILEAQRYHASELPPRAFPKAQNGPAAACAGAVNDGFKSQEATAAKKTQQVDKFQEILSQYTSEFRSTFNARGVPSSLESLHHWVGDGETGGAREAKLASEKYSQRLEALKSRMELAKKAAEESKISLQREKKTELELKELEDNMSRMKALRLGKPEQEEVRVALPVLTEEDYQEYQRLTKQPERTILADHTLSNIEIKGHDMATLGPSTWLNDEIINVCMSMLQERDKRHREALKRSPTCHFFNSFFLNKLYKDSGKYNYNDVRRWTLPVRLKNAGQPFTSILDCDRIIIPGNQGNMHWVCAVIDIKNHKFIMYDSLGGNDHACLENLARYLVDEYKNKRQEDREDIMDWPREFPKDIPMQKNCVDCGMFTILFADYASQCAVMDFSQANIQDFRVRTVRDIMRLKMD